MSAAHIARSAMAFGYLLIAIYCLFDAKRRLPYAYAYASAILPFGLALAQLCSMAKEVTAFLDGLSLIVMGVACGLILSESMRRHVSERRGEHTLADGAERPFLR